MNTPVTHRRPQQIPEQVIRLGVLFAVVIVVVLLLRFVIIPNRYIDQELHAKLATRVVEKLPIRYAGSAVCFECHDWAHEDKQAGFHQQLSCESCHGPAFTHVEEPTEHALIVPRKRAHCVRCHAFDPARPTGFPQIDPTSHNPLRPCLNCHDAHSPKPQEPPRECSACHGAIARTKAVSPHGLLPCTECHRVPEAHKTTPRTVWPSKPRKREFCLRCHGTEATPEPTYTAAPRTKTDHGERHLCWQCHYPHMPELDRETK